MFRLAVLALVSCNEHRVCALGGIIVGNFAGGGEEEASQGISPGPQKITAQACTNVYIYIYTHTQ